MKKTETAIRIVQNGEKRSWDNAIHHPLQSWAWGEFRTKMGIDTVRLGMYEKNSLVDGIQITFHAIPHTRFTVGYIPKCPMPTQQILDELTKLGKRKNAVFIQIEPNIQKQSAKNPPAGRTGSQLSAKLNPSHRPLFTKYTFILDLSKSEEELLMAMHPKTRYNIKVAQKHNVIIKEDNSNEAFNAYLRLSRETAERQKFYAHNETYHRTMWDTMRNADIAHLFTASYQGEILTAWIIFVWKDIAYYPYGASSRIHRDVMAPNLMLWEIARWAKREGLRYFDLWGALGLSASVRTDNPWYGFHRFKEGYAPNLVAFIGSYDLVIRPFLYTLYCTADSIRWYLLHLARSHL